MTRPAARRDGYASLGRKFLGGGMADGTRRAACRSRLASPGPERRWTVKVTGLILAMFGLVGGVILLVALVQPTHPTADTGVMDSSARLSLVVPLIVCAAAFVIGLLMFVFGGRGYWE